MAPSLEYADHVAELARTEPELAREVAGWHGLESVLGWLETRKVKGAVDLVGFDEFEYDFLIELNPDRWLVFGVT